MATKVTFIKPLIIGLCLYLPAVIASAGPKTDAAESQSVTLSWTAVGKSGVVNAEGCEQCPMQFQVDNKTKFSHHGKHISAKKTSEYSGNPGTVIYTVANKHALKVLW